MSKSYAEPRVMTLGSLEELTERDDKCGGSGDAFSAQIGITLSNTHSPTGNCNDPNQVFPVP
jgi:hypothetical protein